MHKLFGVFFLLLLLAGCTQDSGYDVGSGERVISINEYFNDEISVYYKQMVDTGLTCQSGDCPVLEVDDTARVEECFFCDSNISGLRGDELFLSIGHSGGADSFAGCTTKFDEFEISGEFEIINRTDNLIQALVVTTGDRERVGDCDTVYEYNYSSTWIYTFMDETELDLNVSTTALMEYPQAGDVPCLEYCNTQSHESCDGFKWNISGSPPACNCSYQCGAGGPEGEYVIRLPGSKSGQIVSNETITVRCSHPVLQNPSAYLILKEVNGVPQPSNRVSSYPIGVRVKESSPNMTVFQLYSFWDANYTLAGGCSSSADDLEVVDNATEVKVIVTGSSNGPLPLNRYS